MVLQLLTFLLLLSIGSSKVVELTSANFDKQVSNGLPWVIKFYAPWCGHCKKLVPVFESCSQQMEGKAMFGKVDATVQIALAERFPVRGYPSLFSIRNGKVRKYQGRQRTSETLNAFAMSEEGTPLGMMESPLGPIGKIKAYLFAVGEKGIRFHEYLIDSYAFSSVTAGVLLFIIGCSMTGMATLFMIWMFTSSEQQHLHHE